MQYVTRPLITDLNPHLLCVLCGGYYIDATAIIECLHSFCKSCIVRYLETRKYCPICDVLVHKTKPLQNLRPDTVLQSIVYKLVPNLYEKEMRNRRQYYGKVHFSQHPRTAEEKGVITELSKFYSSSDTIDFSLEYVNYSECHFYVASNSQRYFRCQASVTICQLRKLIEAKYPTTTKHQVRFFYNEIQLPEYLTLLDVAYISAWKRLGFIRLLYEIQLEKKIVTIPQPPSLTNHVELTSDTSSPSPRNDDNTITTKTSTEESPESVVALEPIKETPPAPVAVVKTASSPIPSTAENENEISVNWCSISTATNTSTSSVTVTCSMDSGDITTSSVGSPIASSACVVTVNGISSPKKALSPIASPGAALDTAEQIERPHSEISIEENPTKAVEQRAPAPEKTKDTNETARVPSPPPKRPLEEETQSMMPIQPQVNPSELSPKPAKIPKLSGLVEKILSANKLPGLTIELQKTVTSSTSAVSSTPTTTSTNTKTSVKASITVVPSLRTDCVQKSSPRPIFNRADVPTITKSTTKIMKNFTRPWNCSSTNSSSADIVEVNNKSKSSKIIKVRPTPPRPQVDRSMYDAPSLSPSSSKSSSVEDPVKKSSVPPKIFPVMKIDPQTLSPIVTTTANSIVPVSPSVPRKAYSPYVPPVSELYTGSGPFTSSGLSTYTSPNLTTKPPGSYVMPNPLLPINQLMYEMYGNGSRTFEYMKAMTTNFCPPSIFHPSLHPSMNPFYNSIQKKYEKKTRLHKSPSSDVSPPSVQRIPPSNNNTKLAISEHSSSEKKHVAVKQESVSNGQMKQRAKKTDTSSSFSINNLIPLEMDKHTGTGSTSSHACSADGVHQICDQMQTKKNEHTDTTEMKKAAADEGNKNNNSRKE